MRRDGDTFVPLDGDAADTEAVTYAFRKLVEIGPDALPTLLGNLGSDFETKCVIESPQATMGQSGDMFRDDTISGNPLNLAESRVIHLDKHSWDRAVRNRSHDLESYRVKHGDVCFAVIGQIVNRDYLAVDSNPALGVSVCSPVSNRELQESLRAIWQSEYPRQKLLESLVVDFCTYPTDPENAAGLGLAIGLQTGAARRLLYYFPDQGRNLVARRLDDLVVSGESERDRYTQNHGSAARLIEAVAWCEVPEVRAALHRVAERATDESVVKVLRDCGIADGQD
jgi:hypothetical protein